jgi:hypothetical protein
MSTEKKRFSSLRGSDNGGKSRTIPTEATEMPKYFQGASKEVTVGIAGS